MNPFASPSPSADSLGILPSRLWAALALLREAREAAGAVQREAWQFAVEIAQLRAAGLTNTDLRWLLCQGYAEHALEQTPPRAVRRSFQPLTSLTLPEESCFVLTAEGVQLAGQKPANRPTDEVGPDGVQVRTGVPSWDGRLRQLRWQGRVVKHFKLPAVNQEAILAALEEEGWPARMDDPLPRTVDVDPRARLHDTIKGLNRNQVHRLLCFRGDGTGRGVVWCPAAPS